MYDNLLYSLFQTIYVNISKYRNNVFVVGRNKSADLGHRGESYKDRCLLLRLHNTGNSWLRPSLVSPNLFPNHFSSLVWSESLKVRMSMKEILEGCINYLWYLSFVICIIKVRFNKFWKRDWISMIFWNQIMIKKNWSKMVCEVFWQG